MQGFAIGPSEVALRKQLGFGAVSTFLEDFALMETVIVVGAHTSATYPCHLDETDAPGKRRADKSHIG